MKVSEITQETILNHIREDTDNLEEKLNEHEDITIAVLTLISDMWDNRSMTIQRGNVNIVVDTILGMHRMNLVPTPDSEVI